jgi:hypothetical protein
MDTLCFVHSYLHWLDRSTPRLRIGEPSPAWHPSHMVCGNQEGSLRPMMRWEVCRACGGRRSGGLSFLSPLYAALAPQARARFVLILLPRRLLSSSLLPSDSQGDPLPVSLGVDQVSQPFQREDRFLPPHCSPCEVFICLLLGSGNTPGHFPNRTP